MNNGGSAGGSAPQRRVPRVHCIHRITSSVHSYLRSISTAGGARLFFYFTIRMFERFTHHIITGLVLQYIPNLSNFHFQGVPPPPRRAHRITSSVYSYLRSISTAGGALVGDGGGRPSLFLLYKSDVREIYDNMHQHPRVVLQYISNLSNFLFQGVPPGVPPPHDGLIV